MPFLFLSIEHLLICNQTHIHFPFQSNCRTKSYSLARASLSIPNSYIYRIVFLANLPMRTPRTIKSWYHPPPSPLVRTASQGLADHPTGLSTAPAPAQSVHCPSCIYIVHSRSRTCPYRVRRAGGTDTRYNGGIYIYIFIYICKMYFCCTRLCECERPRYTQRGTHKRAIANDRQDTTCRRCIRTRVKTDRVAFRDILTCSRICGKR